MIRGTWLLSGLPRSGTSLCCRLAAELSDTVALSEPLRRSVFAGVETEREACSRIEHFAVQARTQIPVHRRAPSVQVDGRLDDDRVGPEPADGRLRLPQGGHGEIEVDKPLSGKFTLLIKHNALFAALLPRLTESLRCLALVRNPLVVMASWQTVDLPVHSGRIPAGEQFDRHLARTLDDEPEVLRRQLEVMNWFFGRFRAHLDPASIIRYEDLVQSGGRALFRVLGHADAAPAPLKNRNRNPMYRGVATDTLLSALLREPGPWSEFYSVADCESAADMISSMP